MARDYLTIVRAIEGLYYKARGLGDTTFTNQDEPLRIALPTYANGLLRELERLRRWRLGWKTAQVVTAAGEQTYNLPSDCSTVKRIWWRRASGSVRLMTRADEIEVRLIKGEPPGPGPGLTNVPPVLGQPAMWAMMPPLGPSFQSQGQFEIWPAPDGNGPDSGNYTLQIDYYSELGQIFETTCTALAGAGSLTLATNAGNYLLAQGVASAGGTLGLTVRGGGYNTGVTALGNDDFTTPWLALAASAVTLPVGTTIPSAVTNAPTFFNSQNWLIRSFPKVILFGMLREVASYLKDQQGVALWAERYKQELDLLVEWDDDAGQGAEILAVVVGGQLQPIFRDIDLPQLYEIRGQ